MAANEPGERHRVSAAGAWSDTGYAPEEAGSRVTTQALVVLAPAQCRYRRWWPGKNVLESF